jgi:hypothetical protein
MSESSVEEEARKISASAKETAAREAAARYEAHQEPPLTVRKAPKAETNETALLPKGEEAKPDSVQKRATVHEKTVKQVAAGQIKTAKKARKRPAKKAGAKKTAPKPDRTVSVITPLPAVWEAAKTLANGDTKLLLVKSPTEVIVMNHPGQFERKAGN